MTDPKENEEINEELSTDELKDVAGGGMGLDRLGTQFSQQSSNPSLSNLEDRRNSQRISLGDENDSNPFL